ncbi:hypothetical protein MRB53_001958 [Persea americana]|uniref:Uncharacterized protein n=1 Tax=Persea americana TaxID=3435 RepID=A0ACC2MU23_PERAE|nr:hypothetical protein MRB53_001958 [Persea americana]
MTASGKPLWRSGGDGCGGFKGILQSEGGSSGKTLPSFDAGHGRRRKSGFLLRNSAILRTKFQLDSLCRCNWVRW